MVIPHLRQPCSDLRRNGSTGSRSVNRRAAGRGSDLPAASVCRAGSPLRERSAPGSRISAPSTASSSRWPIHERSVRCRRVTADDHGSEAVRGGRRQGSPETEDAVRQAVPGTVFRVELVLHIIDVSGTPLPRPPVGLLSWSATTSASRPRRLPSPPGSASGSRSSPIRFPVKVHKGWLDRGSSRCLSSPPVAGRDPHHPAGQPSRGSAAILGA